MNFKTRGSRVRSGGPPDRQDSRRRRPTNYRFIVAALFLGFPVAGSPLSAATQGVLSTFTSTASGVTDVRHDRLVALAVPDNTPPTSLLPAGAFQVNTATSLTMPLRTEVTFSLAGSGGAKLTINGEVALDETTTISPEKLSAPIRLNKGANQIELTYTSPAHGDAWYRLYWAGKDFGREPLPTAQLSCEVTSEVAQNSQKIRTGRELFADLHCAKCHDAALPASGGLPELADDPPSLEDAGARLRKDWIAAWIANPKRLRPDTTMPRVHMASPQDAADLAAFLGAQGKPGAAPEFSDEQTATGRGLFVDLHCIACHALPDHDLKAGDLSRVSLGYAAAKWQPAALVSFLKNPADYHPAIRMPNFSLSQEEATALTAFIFSRDGGTVAKTAGNAAHGKELFETTGCLQCHAPTGGATNRVAPAKAVAALDWTRGCLAETAEARGATAPDFALGAAEREALRAFAKTGLASLKQDAPVEYSERQYTALRCAACHARDGKDGAYASLTDEISALKGEGSANANAEAPPGEESASLDQDPPHLTWAGEKLKTEWLQHFIAGELNWRPRPWLKARMPAFTARAAGLARGLALEHGVLPAASSAAVAAPAPLDAAKAKTGAALTMPDAFNCITCHAVGAQAASAPFGSPGIDFARVSERVREEWFRRWLDNPPRITPNTKMPKFTDEAGHSRQAGVLGGDAHAQWDAIYEYLRRIHETGK